jgi:hypothetical protein
LEHRYKLVGITRSPLTILCDAVQGQTWLYDYSSATDNGTPIAFFFETKDYESPTELVTFDGFYAKGTGNNVLVEISFDRGQTWQTVGTLNFGLTPTQQQVNLQITAQSFRLRVSGSDPTFSMDWYRTDWYDSTPW